MKSMLIVALLLMSAAAVYGFIDYRKARNTPAFERMYQQETTTPPVVDVAPVTLPEGKTEVSATGKPVAEQKQTKTVTSKRKKKAPSFEFEKFSRAPLREVRIAPEEKED